ncbi:hypothetical protein PR202_ga09964 [Eleusine coracana subsp. coracana]|uniref:Uncharacterized protein n=1 Tax=Eleusine coracana subsp. coracana TaxID=191504 RepID=A0AAV5C4F7_ELECO|nr:hypothetical protein PR202_ga09964 [Eleusine coracana subsp. coracana]
MFDSQSPGAVTPTFSLFATKPAMPMEVLAKTFLMTEDEKKGWEGGEGRPTGEAVDGRGQRGDRGAAGHGGGGRRSGVAGAGVSMATKATVEAAEEVAVEGASAG